jgi:hypothetical protein
LITLRSEEGKLIRVESWDDIQTRPRFTPNLDPQQHQLASIIGRYIFREPIRCGLSDCHTPHQKGYIVLTKDNRETNIGKDCGRKYFGVEFETMSRQYEQDLAAMENRERLWSVRFRIEEVEAKIDGLRTGERGADWLYRKLQALVTLNMGCPEKVIRTFSGMVKARSSTLNREREATDEEVRAVEARENRRVRRPQYIAEPVGEVAAMEALYPEKRPAPDIGVAT